MNIAIVQDGKLTILTQSIQFANRMIAIYDIRQPMELQKKQQEIFVKVREILESRGVPYLIFNIANSRAKGVIVIDMDVWLMEKAKTYEQRRAK